MNDSDREAIEKKIAVLGHTVALVLADIRLELLALRGVLIDLGVIEPDAVMLKAESLRASQIPKLTPEASGDLRTRFEHLCQQLGIDS